jgi:3-dehydroquinate synthase
MAGASTPGVAGAYTPGTDRFGPFSRFAGALRADCFVLADARVAALHPPVARLLRHRDSLAIRGGEGSKSLAVLERVLTRARALSRDGTFVCIGGGSIGDLGTVAAHLLKRGVRLVHVPTTLLAAVDSSLGGKGALNLAGAKNLAGVFHFADEVWICTDFFATLSEAQHRDGRIEAFKMAVTLSPDRSGVWRHQDPPLSRLIREARALKAAVCARDPYERLGQREVLNFGHTLGHTLEALNAPAISHGAAVRLGIACALDVGRALGATPEDLARDVEARIEALGAAKVPHLRRDLARALSPHPTEAMFELFRVDKKARAGEIRMVLLQSWGRANVRPVPTTLLRRLTRAWREGRRP